MGHTDEAIRSYEAALKIQPNHYNSLYFLASRLLRKHDDPPKPEEIMRIYTCCIALRPDLSHAYASRADCYKQLGRLEEAEADINKSIEVESDVLQWVEGFLVRSQFYADIGECRKAELGRIHLIEHLPYLLANLEHEVGRSHYKTLRAMHRLAHLYRDMGHPDRSSSLFAGRKVVQDQASLRPPLDMLSYLSTC